MFGHSKKPNRLKPMCRANSKEKLFTIENSNISYFSNFRYIISSILGSWMVFFSSFLSKCIPSTLYCLHRHHFWLASFSFLFLSLSLCYHFAAIHSHIWRKINSEFFRSLYFISVFTIFQIYLAKKNHLFIVHFSVCVCICTVIANASIVFYCS